MQRNLLTFDQPHYDVKTVRTNKLLTVQIKFDLSTNKFYIEPVLNQKHRLHDFFDGNDYDVKVLMGIVANIKHFLVAESRDLIKRFLKTTEELSTDTDTKTGCYSKLLPWTTLPDAP